MSAAVKSHAPDRHANYNKTRLYFVSCLALTMAGINYSMRATTADALQKVYLDPVDPIHAATMIATVLGLPFLGFAFTIAIGSPLLDYIGMRLLLPLSGICFSLGMLTIIFADRFASGAGIYNVLWVGALITGIGWGLVETVVNPLIATLYPDEKTGKLNSLHAWWPGGIVIGGLLGVGMSSLDMSWQAKLAVVFVPAIAVVLLSLGLKFPPTERAASGVSVGEMFRELANPLFVVLFLAMFLTAASELAPGQWVDLALSRTVHMPGILLLVYVSGLMFVMRHFAGALVHRLASVGVLWVSCLLASLGLVALSFADSPVLGLTRRDAVGNWSVLHVADHAGNRVRALSSWWRTADGINGDGGNIVDSVCASQNGRDFRYDQSRGCWRRSAVQRVERR